MSVTRKSLYELFKPWMDATKFNDASRRAKIDEWLSSAGIPPDPVSAPAATVAGALVPSESCFDIIQSFEGYEDEQPDGSCIAYPDPATGGAPWTIGWGTTGPDVSKGTHWTRAQADARFNSDITKFSEKVRSLLAGAPTTQHQFDAMVSMAYNVGEGNFGGSTLLKKHRAGDHAGAADEFPKWNKANKKVMGGLTRRRAAERDLYLS